MYNLLDIIKQRYSCRNYKPERINDLTKRELLSYIQVNNTGLWGEKIELQIIEKTSTSKPPMKLDYGIITNHNSYIVGKVKKGYLNRMAFGFVVEKAVIKATALGLNTCWIGYFDEKYFSDIQISDEYEIPSIVIVGYASKESVGNKFIRLSVKATKRKDWKELFYHNDFSTPLSKSTAIEFQDSLEMVRLAPSSGNTQPWRIVFDTKNKIFHFYKKVISPKYEAKGLHDVDLGIAASHFDLGVKLFNLQGKWQVLDQTQIVYNENLKYMISWVGK